MAKGSSSPAKTKKSAAAPAHPKYEDMIRDAIVALKERKGSSRQAIKKYILTTYKLPDNSTTNNRLRLAINRGVEKGIFSFPNGPSGTIKLVKKEAVKKEKKEPEKKEKPKKVEKKETKPKVEKVTKKTTTRKAPVRKAAAASTKKAAAKPKKATTTSSKRGKASTTKKVAEKKTGTRRRAAASS
ncbi:8674_t:CDS:2 [Funneliformis caledonium]|uniref:Histone H1 n=2 Tax=Funneliformis TaxID=1117308 RepID=A0A9N9BRQ0_9GLOM|nr:5863_t:CDS:2 [Funneliformis mosseae]CAG8573524.1 8674_t:CDS:2 [Funneliformis caledonium]